MPPTVLLSCDGLSKSFGSRPLFEGLSLSISEGDHIGLIGPNGSGKSTLMRILAGAVSPDSGTLSIRRGLKVGYVPQDPEFEPGLTVEDVLFRALDGQDLDEYEKSARIGVAMSKAQLASRAERTDVLSGGWRKRLAIARELVREPDVLLLDEPTNHLDVQAILWLESLLRSEPEAFVVVSHDRYFLENVARRMVELNPTHAGGLLQINGSYVDFLERRDELLREQAAYRDTLANLVRREVEWLRRGAKARTTKAKARIDNANRLIDELGESRERSRTGSAGIDFTASERKTKRLWAASKLRKRFGDRMIVDGVDILLSPGTRLGILGPNGSGKTTLLRMIVGDLEPDSGMIERADALRIVYFEQSRETLDPGLTLRRALAPEGDTVIFRDKPLHVAGWAKRFLFKSEQLEQSVSKLSGGEKARVMIARLMLRPADLLILDEPTNDLDIPTLDVLEEALLDFPGALVLVTHDRYLLDRVSTSILALDGQGGAQHFADYAQWETSRATAAKAAVATAAQKVEPAKPKKKLSYNEQREWDTLEARILEAEQRAAVARERAEDPGVAADAAALQERFAELTAATEEVERLYERWAELEEKLGT